LRTRSQVYHFHDPELIPFGILLRLFGKTVIFDIHENIAKQIRVKTYLPMRNFISRLYGWVDWISSKAFFLILAEHSYQKIYDRFTDRYEIILNMPDISLLSRYRTTDRPVKESIELYYVGGITFERGIKTIVEAMQILKRSNHVVRFHCVGPYEGEIMNKIRAIQGFDEVGDTIFFYGPQRLDLALQRSESCHIGLSILLPIENYLESYSTKIFEYMAIGLPVITSNFPLYKNVVERYRCGFCVDPRDAEQLADRILELGKKPDMLSEMGRNGIRAAQDQFNWSKEEEKLLSVYTNLTSP
jgi:glycosyltransferase involved in cell wall biosynthesis